MSVKLLWFFIFLTKIQSMVHNYLTYDLDPKVEHTRKFAPILLLYVIYAHAKFETAPDSSLGDFF